MAPCPADADVLAACAGSRGRERDRSFSVEQFESLVSSALDIQGIPDSALAFSFGGKIYPPAWVATRSEDQKTRRRKTGTFSRLRGAFTRKFDASLNVPPETRRLASSSVPTLSHPLPQSVPTSTSLVSLDLDRSCLSSPSHLATRLPSISLPSSGFYNGPVNHTYIRASPSLDISPSDRTYASVRSFLNLKPLNIPKLTKKLSEGPFPPGCLPTPPEQPRPLPPVRSEVNNDSSLTESEGLRSFLDDSGFEEDLCLANVTKKKSKASFRSLFSSAVSECLPPSVRSGHKHDKTLPPTPAPDNVFRRDRHLSSKTDDRDSLFYSLPNIQQGLQPSSSEALDTRAKSDKEIGTSRVANWIVRSTTSTPRKAKRIVHSSPPAYPSPTSPLPPTPNFTSMGSPPASLLPPVSTQIHAVDNVGDISEESIDSMEILSWRMRGLEQQVSKTSTTSSSHAHALGRPSRGSIRERLGLGPRLQVHVPLPTHFLSESNRRSKSRDGRSLELLSVHGRNTPGLNTPRSPRASSSTRMPLPRLASASLVSLRSIATITAGGAGIREEGEYDIARKDTIDVDRAFTPEDDPFAPGPLTPITPSNPLFESNATRKEKYRSFMPLGNDSSTSLASPETPISSPASLPSWHYRLGANSNMSSPALTPTSSLRRETPVPKKDKRDANQANARSRLAPSIVEALNIRDGALSAPLPPPSSRSNLSRVISSVRKIQNNNDRHLSSKPDAKKQASRVVGHTESRPHSPFPMLFLRPGMAKTVPAVRSESRRSRSASIIRNEVGEDNKGRLPVSPPASPKHEPLLARRLQGQIAAPVAPYAKEIDAIADSAKCYAFEIPKRDIVSPTAWLLDSDDYDDNGSVHDDDVLASQSNVLALNLISRSQTIGQQCDLVGIERSDTEPVASVDDTPCASQSTRYCKTQNEAGTEGDATLLRASQAWPLPPHRTVVVDEDSGEGYHTVDPVVEFIPGGSVMYSPRHSIRVSKRNSGSTSIGSPPLENGSPVSQKLNRSQTRLIADHYSHSQDMDDSSMVKSPISLQTPKPQPVRPLKQRSRSATSLASVNAWSLKTSRTAFYSARSTASRGSDRSTFSFKHSQQVGILSREGSSHSASSSRSPPSSAGHHAKHPAAQTELSSNSRSGSATGAKPSASIAQRSVSSVPVREVIIIPERIVLSSTDPASAFHVIVSGWKRLLSVCERYGSICIETSEGRNEYELLSVLVEEVGGSSSEITEPRPNASALHPGIDTSDRRSDGITFVKLSLSLQRTCFANSRRSKVAFCLPLPATLGGVVDMLKQTHPFPSAT